MNNPTGLKKETRSEWQKRARQRQTVIHDVMPRTLTWPSGVSFFSRLHSPYWPLLPPSLDLSRPFKHKVMMLACVMNPPPDPEGTRRGPTPGWQEAWWRCTIWLAHAARVLCVSSVLWRTTDRSSRAVIRDTRSAAWDTRANFIYLCVSCQNLCNWEWRKQALSEIKICENKNAPCKQMSCNTYLFIHVSE